MSDTKPKKIRTREVRGDEIPPHELLGKRVRTEGDTHFVSTGIVQTISECGRIAKVVKTYGQKCRFERFYKVSTLFATMPIQRLVKSDDGKGARPEQGQL